MRISDWSSDVCSSDLYGELAIPVFDAGESFPGSFRLSAAGRYEDYSDVGDTANPKFGARWEPLPGVALRASYGRSFRAPFFDELVGSVNSRVQTFRQIGRAHV